MSATGAASPLPRIYCQADSHMKPGYVAHCRWLAAYLCKSCKLSVCAGHWDAVAGVCQACARIIGGFPN